MYRGEYNLIVDESKDWQSTDWTSSTVNEVLDFIDQNSDIDSTEILIFVRDDFSFENMEKYEKDQISTFIDPSYISNIAEEKQWLQKIERDSNLYGQLSWLIDRWKEGYTILIM